MGNWRISVEDVRSRCQGIATRTETVTADIADAEAAIEALAFLFAADGAAQRKLRGLSSAWSGTARSISARVSGALGVVSGNVAAYIEADSEMSSTTKASAAGSTTNTTGGATVAHRFSGSRKPH